VADLKANRKTTTKAAALKKAPAKKATAGLRTKSGAVRTPEAEAALLAEAESGYDPGELVPRKVLRDFRHEHDRDIAFEHEVELFGARGVGVPLVVSWVVFTLSRCRSWCRRIPGTNVPRRSPSISPRVP